VSRLTTAVALAEWITTHADAVEVGPGEYSQPPNAGNRARVDLAPGIAGFPADLDGLKAAECSGGEVNVPRESQAQRISSSALRVPSGRCVATIG
jgi:hypothetical protein